MEKHKTAHETIQIIFWRKLIIKSKCVKLKNFTYQLN